MKYVDCFYRLFGKYACWNERSYYNCPECRKDELNKNCKHYSPVQLAVINVGGVDDHKVREK